MANDEPKNFIHFQILHIKNELFLLELEMALATTIKKKFEPVWMAPYVEGKSSLRNSSSSFMIQNNVGRYNRCNFQFSTSKCQFCLPYSLYNYIHRDCSKLPAIIGGIYTQLTHTMRTNLPKLLTGILHLYTKFSLEFFIMIFFATNQLDISKFLPPQVCKTLISD